ncbi:MAG: tripartite tricarboxylate transporter permease [Clostridia bacterium]|nr:tripartite tricarboxylate transporter permease [Clostridia bacterium]MBR3130545.1 tripartite tricarboxylate transporter permease [Clostridia bacterium]
MQNFLSVLHLLIRPEVLFPAALGTLMGVYIGAIPGLSGTMAVSLLVSLTYTWSETPAIALIMGVFVGVVYGGSRSAILLNIPGAPAAVATGFDGYPLARKGKAAEAMGLACVQSFIGTILGILALAFLTPQISKISSLFRSVDYLLLGVLALLLVGSVSKGRMTKGLLGAALGLFLGCVGNTSQFSVNRFTFGVRYLDGGIGFIVAMIGLFGAGEALYQLSIDAPTVRQDIPKRIVPPFRTILKHLPLTLFSSVLGIFVGALPGAGGDMAALLGYDAAKRTVRRNEVPFGEGAVEGLIAPETANNAAIGGALIPMLTLGVPGDAITAVLLGALSMRGVSHLSLQSARPDLYLLILAALVLSALFLLLFGLTGIRLFVRMLHIPKGLLMPVILMLCTVGAYAINANIYDVLLMVGFGLLGFVMKRFDYPVAPIVLGLILRNLLETNAIRVVLLSASGGVFGALTPFLAALLIGAVILGQVRIGKERI